MVFAGDPSYASLGGPARHLECSGSLPSLEARERPTAEQREAARREVGLPIEGLALYGFDLPLGAEVANDACNCLFVCQGRDHGRPWLVILRRTSLCSGQRCAFPHEGLLELPGAAHLAKVPGRPMFFRLVDDLSPD